MYEFLRYTVRDAMTSSPVTVSTSTVLREVEEIFEAHDFNGVPVVGEENRLIGMMTKFDLLKAFIFTPDAVVPNYDQIMEQAVQTVMTINPETVVLDLPLSRLLQQLVARQIKSFPVVEKGFLVGIISREDVLRALQRATSQH
jgi:CBS domain-containing protein